MNKTQSERHEPVALRQIDLEKRRESISRQSKEEFCNLKRYIDRLLRGGYEFAELNDILAGYSQKKTEGIESFRFRYITLAGTLIQDNQGIRLLDEFDVYEYRKKDATLVLRKATIENIDQALASLK